MPGCGSGLMQGQDLQSCSSHLPAAQHGGPGLQDLGSFVYFPETNLPANLLLTEIKSTTECDSGDPKSNPVLKALWYRHRACASPGQQI